MVYVVLFGVSFGVLPLVDLEAELLLSGWRFWGFEEGDGARVGGLEGEVVGLEGLGFLDLEDFLPVHLDI